MAGFLKRLFSSASGSDMASVSRARITLQSLPDIIFAVGDVHGCIDELRQLESRIAEAASGTSASIIIMLGDYVDRGEDTAAVLDHLARPAPQGMSRICLCGNHEQMMLDAYELGADIDRWLALGGLETMISYGVDHASLADATGDARRLQQILKSHIPPEHMEFLKSLPSAVLAEDYIFVHAGVRAGWSLPDQTDEDLMWSRDDYESEPHNLGLCVVHGHTPVETPVHTQQHINVDTGAYMSGHLTAAVLPKNGDVSFLAT